MGGGALKNYNRRLRPFEQKKIAEDETLDTLITSEVMSKLTLDELNLLITLGAEDEKLIYEAGCWRGRHYDEERDGERRNAALERFFQLYEEKKQKAKAGDRK